MSHLNIVRDAKAQKISVGGKKVFTLTRTETFEATDIAELKNMLAIATRDKDNAVKQMDELSKFIAKIDCEITELEVLIAAEEAEELAAKK